MWEYVVLFLDMLKSIFRPFTRQVGSTNSCETLRRALAWQLHSYGEDLQCCEVRIPIISSPTEVIVKVEATSVNAIDALMKEGYGRAFNKVFQCKFTTDSLLPMTLGRDFSGTIIDKGINVKEFEVGDKVYGVIPFHKPGCHAEFATAEKTHILHKPSELSHTEAAAIPYAALTAYAALWTSGGLSTTNAKGTKVLILGASGGVGNYAIQMLRAVGATVVGTCSTDAVPIVQMLGAHYVFDYRSPEYVHNVACQGKYDIILDCAQMGYDNIPNSWEFKQFISLNSPLLLNTDKYGLLGGLTLSVGNLLCKNISGLTKGNKLKWAFFNPSTDGLKFIDKLVKNDQMRPIIHKIFKFDELPTAYKVLQAGHLRGKVVVDYLKK